jgi:hypothetical protein
MFRAETAADRNGRRDSPSRRYSKAPSEQASKARAFSLILRPLGLTEKPICTFPIAFGKFRRNCSIGARNLDPTRLPLKARPL